MNTTSAPNVGTDIEVIDFTIERLWRLLNRFRDTIYLRFCTDGRLKIFMDDESTGLVVYASKAVLQGCQFSTNWINIEKATTLYRISNLSYVVKCPNSATSITSAQLTIGLKEKNAQDANVAEYSMYELPYGDTPVINERARLMAVCFGDEPKHHLFYQWWYGDRCQYAAAEIVATNGISTYVKDLVNNVLPKIDDQFTISNPDVAAYINSPPPMKVQLSSMYGQTVSDKDNAPEQIHLDDDDMPHIVPLMIRLRGDDSSEQIQPDDKKEPLLVRLRSVCKGSTKLPPVMTNEGRIVFIDMKDLDRIKGDPYAVYYGWSGIERSWFQLCYGVDDEHPDGIFVRTSHPPMSMADLYKRFPDLRSIYGDNP